MLDCHAHINDPGFTWRGRPLHARKRRRWAGVTTLTELRFSKHATDFRVDAFLA